MRFLICTLLIGNFLSAQNLVVNPGFEESGYANASERKWCVLDMIHPHGWSSPTISSPDFYFVPESDTSQNKLEYRPLPYEGNAYAGFFATPTYFEYVQGTLEQPLKAGQVYPVSFAIASASNQPYDPVSIGICFSDVAKQFNKDVGVTSWLQDPDAVMDTANLDETDERWDVFTFLYTAHGGERSFIIGMFTAPEQEGSFVNGGPYFFIDNVIIGKDEAPIPAPVDTIAEVENEIAAGKTLVANNIYFETGKSKILPESYSPLYEIIIELKLQPNLKVEIVGHTDAHGDKTANQKLSEERAKAVADFFISKGIDAARITTRGCGSTQPVGDDDQKNRRVEFIFSE